MGKRIMWVLWPSFLMAGVAEMVFFAMVDPGDIHVHGVPVDLARDTIYSIAFFAFWVVTAASSALTVFLAASPFEINRCPLPEDHRPDGCPKQVCAPDVAVHSESHR